SWSHRSSYTVREADHASLEPRDGSDPLGNEPLISVCRLMRGAPGHHANGEPLGPILGVLRNRQLQLLYRREQLASKSDRRLKGLGKIMQGAELLNPPGVIG